MILTEDNFFLETVEEVLEEAGFASWLKRYFTGMDKNLIREIEDSMADIKTERQKRNALEEIDTYIHQSIGTTGDQKMTTAASLFVPIPGSFIYPQLARLIAKIATGEDRDRYRKMLYDLRAQVSAIKVKD